MSDRRVYIERRAQGDYAVRRANSERASGVAPTQAEAIALAIKMNPGVSPHVERVRHTSYGSPDKWRKAFRVPPLFVTALAVFVASAAWVASERPVGAAVAGAFIGLVMVLSVAIRAWRSAEFRFESFEFADKATEHEWEKLTAADLPILVPVRPPLTDLREKEIDVRLRHRIPGTLPVVFVLAELADPSDFQQRPLVRIAREDGRIVIHITRCCSLAHAIAAAAVGLAKTGGVPEVHFGWSAENPVTANLHFVLFGMGNVPWMVHTLIRRAQVPEDRKPPVVVA